MDVIVTDSEPLDFSPDCLNTGFSFSLFKFVALILFRFQARSSLRSSVRSSVRSSLIQRLRGDPQQRQS